LVNLGDLRIDTAGHSVMRGETRVDLTQRMGAA
jgi:two-component system OmpR family response regulator